MKMKKRTYYLSPTHDAMVKKMKKFHKNLKLSESDEIRIAIEDRFNRVFSAPNS